MELYRKFNMIGIAMVLSFMAMVTIFAIVFTANPDDNDNLGGGYIFVNYATPLGDIMYGNERICSQVLDYNYDSDYILVQQLAEGKYLTTKDTLMFTLINKKKSTSTIGPLDARLFEESINGITLSNPIAKTLASWGIPYKQPLE